MLTALEQKRIRDIITETVTLLCQNSLNFRSKFTVEGLLGITIDDKDVFLINIHEVISSRPNVVREKLISSDTVEDNETHTLLESQVVADFKQSSKTKTARKRLFPQSGCSAPCSTSQNVLSYDKLDEEIAHSFKHQAVQSEKLLPAGEKPLETSLPLSSVTDGSEVMPSTSTEGSELQDMITVKEESMSETNASDRHLDDLLMECNSVWPDKEDTHIKVPAASHNAGNESLNTGGHEQVSAVTQYRLVPRGNARGGTALISSDGYRYSVKMIKQSVTYWRCVKRNRICNCRAVVIQRDNAFVRGIHGHCHSPQYTNSND